MLTLLAIFFAILVPFIIGAIDDAMFYRMINHHAERRAFQKRLNRVLKGVR